MRGQASGLSRQTPTSGVVEGANTDVQARWWPTDSFAATMVGRIVFLMFLALFCLVCLDFIFGSVVEVVLLDYNGWVLVLIGAFAAIRLFSARVGFAKTTYRIVSASPVTETRPASGLLRRRKCLSCYAPMGRSELRCRYCGTEHEEAEA